MDNNTVNSSGPSNFNSTRPEMSKPVGPVIGLVLILAIILIGGVYFWMSRQNNQNAYVPPVQEQSAASETKTITTQSSATDGASIDNDLKTFNQTNLQTDSTL